LAIVGLGLSACKEEDKGGYAIVDTGPGGGIAWEIWYHEGEAAQLIEAVSQSWNNLIEDANEL